MVEPSEVTTTSSHPPSYPFRDPSRFERASRDILTLFINSIHRCIYFDLAVIFLARQPIDLEELHLQPPELLQTLIIDGLGFDEFSNSSKEVDFVFNHLFNARNLQSAKWGGKTRALVHKVAQSWENLRSLTLTGLQSGSLSTALSFCENLEQLTITCSENDVDDGPAVVTLPKLTFLATVSPLSPSCLKRLVVPSLKGLKLIILRWAAWGDIFGLIKRSSATLRVLTVQFKANSKEATYLVRVLQEPCFQDLWTLDVDQPQPAMDLVRFLTLPPFAGSTRQSDHPRSQAETGIRYLPHLQKLSMVITLLENEVDKAQVDISKLVESRMGSLDPDMMQDCVAWSSSHPPAVTISLDIPH